MSNSSLSPRIAHRREQLESHQSEWFPIPGYEDVLEVELRLLGYSKIKRVIARNEKVRDPEIRDIE